MAEAESSSVIDELGYLPSHQDSANSIFQVVSRRADQGSILLTLNRGFADWDEVFAGPAVAVVVDHLLGDATVLNTCGRGYRMRAHHDQQRGGAAIVS